MTTRNPKETTVIDLRKQAQKGANSSYSPYSQAKIGSSILTSSGKIFTGTNIENSSFGATICAERVAIFSAIAVGETSFEKIYIYSPSGWPPCGICRQVLSEFCNDSLEIIIGNEKGEEKITTLGSILPFAFTKKFLDN